MQYILEDESSFTIDLKESDLTGLPDAIIATAKEVAVERKKADGMDKHLMTWRSVIKFEVTFGSTTMIWNDAIFCYTGEYVITLSRSLVVPFLTFSDRRDLREKAWWVVEHDQ